MRGGARRLLRNVGKVRDDFAPSATGLTGGLNGSNSEAGEAYFPLMTPSEPSSSHPLP